MYARFTHKRFSLHCHPTPLQARLLPGMSGLPREQELQDTEELDHHMPTARQPEALLAAGGAGSTTPAPVAAGSEGGRSGSETAERGGRLAGFETAQGIYSEEWEEGSWARARHVAAGAALARAQHLVSLHPALMGRDLEVLRQNLEALEATLEVPR